jgi:hypothetical protein
MNQTLLPLMLTGAVFAVVVAAAFIWGQRRPAGAASLEARTASPQTWTHVSSAGSDGETPPLAAEARAVTIDSPEPAGGDSDGASLEIRLPVTTPDCAALGLRLGGGCGSPRDPLGQLEQLSIQSLDSPIQIVMHLEGKGPLDLSQTGSDGSSRPREWTLIQGAPAAQLEIDCQSKDRLLLAGPEGSAAATCGRFGPEYSLRAGYGHRAGPRLHLNGVHWLKARLLGNSGTATIAEGEMTLDGRVQPVNPPEPAAVEIQAEPPHFVALDIDVPRPDAPPHVSLRTRRAATVAGGGQQLPTWIETHPEIAYLVIGAVAGSFLTALIDFLVARWRR